MVCCAGKLIENVISYFMKAIDHTFYRLVIYELFECSPNIPSGLSRCFFINPYKVCSIA